VLCDNGSRYQSKLFNSDSMRSKNLPVPDWLAQKTAMQVPYEKA
jgi:cysteine synthase A